MSEKIKVLIVDDSAIVRSMLEQKLSECSDIEVVGTALDPFVARDKIVRLNPDVVTLDIEMPRMDGLTFLQKLMRYYPVPVIIVSSITAKDSLASIKALELGAFDVVNKPGGSISIQEVVQDVIYKIRQAYLAKTGFLKKFSSVGSDLAKTSALVQKPLLSKVATTDRFILIGSSTGGTLALEYILKNLPAGLPPILIVQHMPPKFTLQFADRLNELAAMTVKEAEDNEVITTGNVYIAMGGMHLTVQRRGAMLYTRFDDSEKVQFQKPAVDVLFASAAEEIGQNALGILLTGMGKDGAEGLLKMKNSGAKTIAQDEATSIVWGMPKAAIDLGAAQEILPLDKIPKRIVEWCQ